MSKDIKKENRIFLLLVLICIFLLIIVSVYITCSKSHIEEKIDKNKITKIEVLATAEQMKYLKKNTDTEPFIKVDVIINGRKITNCGLRTKGSTIYSKLGETSNPTRFGYLLELDHYKKNQSYDGVTKFLLNTNPYDKTTIREMICYDIYEIAGVKIAKRSLCDLTIAGKDEGIYTLVEVPTENFIKRTYGNTNGVIYKPKVPVDDENKNVVNMEKILNGKMYGRVNKNKIRLLSNSLKNIENNNSIERYIDIPSMLDYLAVCFFIDNHDSYISETSRNYYIYQQGEKITFLPYDLDLILVDDKDLNGAVLSYEKYNEKDKKPIIYNILSNERYMQEYKERIKKIMDYLENENYIYNKIDYYKKLVNISILYNDNNFFSHSLFKDDISNLKESMHLRIEKVKKELNTAEN